MGDKPNEYDAESEMIEANVHLFLAATAFERGDRRAYLDSLRRAQAHLLGLIMEAEEHAG